MVCFIREVELQEPQNQELFKEVYLLLINLIYSVVNQRLQVCAS